MAAEWALCATGSDLRSVECYESFDSRPYLKTDRNEFQTSAGHLEVKEEKACYLGSSR